jgi:hypothetical protein
MSLVGDEELLYRSVRSDEAPEREGRRVLSSTAFNDTGMKPSVDRALMREPQLSKLSPTDGICGLIAHKVRGITDVIHQGTKRPYAVDVVARPIEADAAQGEPGNPAHAQVEVDPNFENPTRFKRLKESLCRIAEQGWVIEPGQSGLA